MNFKEFLAEVALNDKVFASTIERLSEDAKVGFELECWVPEHSDLIRGEFQDGAATVSLDNITSLPEWIDFFDIDNQTLRDIKHEFAEWKDDSGNTKATFREYYENQFTGAKDFIQTYDLEPLYGWANREKSEVFGSDPTSEGEADFDQTAEAVADELGEFLGVKVHVGYSGDENRWRVVEDGSIDGEGVGVGIEIVSPPTSVEYGLEDLKLCFEFMENADFETNESTGLHINLSLPDLRRKLDPLKLILFMGETHVLKQYKRETNSYAKKHYDDLIQAIRDTGELPKGSDNMLNSAYAMLRKEKYRTVNLSKLTAGYLEFRSAGNTNYHKNYKRIFNDVGRFLRVLEVACSADAERNLYLKKIAKLYGDAAAAPKVDTLEDFVMHYAGIMTWESIEIMMSRTKARPEMSLVNPMFSVMVDLGYQLSKTKPEVPPKVKAEFKQLLQKAAHNDPDILEKVKEKARENSSVNTLDYFLTSFNIK